MTTGYDAPVSVAHIRVRLPDARRKRIHGHMAQVFITLPGMAEVVLPGTTRVRPNFDVNEVVSVSLDLFATCEIEYVDEP